MLGQVRMDLCMERGNSERGPQTQKQEQMWGKKRQGAWPRERNEASVFLSTWEKSTLSAGLNTPLCPPLESLTLGGPLPWLHTSLGLGPGLCACLRFPFTDSCCFLSFFCFPASSKIFCTPLHPAPTLHFRVSVF